MSLKHIDDHGAIESLREFINQVVTANKLKFGFDLYTIYKDDETGKVYGLIHTHAKLSNEDAIFAHELVCVDTKIVHDAIMSRSDEKIIDHLFVMAYFQVFENGRWTGRMTESIPDSSML